MKAAPTSTSHRMAIGTLATLALEVRSVGLGLCNLRFLTNATVAGCDPVPGRQRGSSGVSAAVRGKALGRSSAMLALVLFSARRCPSQGTVSLRLSPC